MGDNMRFAYVGVAVALILQMGSAPGFAAGVTNPDEIKLDEVCTAGSLDAKKYLPWLADNFGVSRKCAPSNEAFLGLLQGDENEKDCGKETFKIAKAKVLTASILRGESTKFAVQLREPPANLSPSRLLGNL
jgi:hypothetical protein